VTLGARQRIDFAAASGFSLIDLDEASQRACGSGRSAIAILPLLHMPPAEQKAYQQIKDHET
jgi:hypothetical protein